MQSSTFTSPRSLYVVGILILLCIGGAIYVGVEYATTIRLKSLTTTVYSQTVAQEELVRSLSNTLVRGGADPVTEQVIRDCSVLERERYETLLGSLNSGLSSVELTELERLFGRCGSYFAEIRLVMTTRLEREVERLLELEAQLQALSGGTSSVDEETWRSLVMSEQKISDSFSNLTTVQDRIILALVGGARPNSEPINALLVEAREIQETIDVTSRQVEEIRQTLNLK
jgi:hypothetical protein